jgi:LytR cell envelope-related transcriptional attenuator
MPPTARGAVLIGILVIAGIVGLQILDDSGASNVKIDSSSDTTATTVGPSATTVALRQPSDVRVKVYNASGVDKQATVMTDKLKALGWATQEPDTLTPTRDGTGVQCVAGFENEAASLATAVGQGATVESYPSSPPAGADQADCLVILGKV